MNNLDMPPDDRQSTKATADFILAELSQPRYRDAFLAALGEGLNFKPPRRHCIRLYAEMLKLVGGERDLAIVVLQKFGARDEDQLRSLVDAGRRMEQLTNDASTSLEQYRDDCVELLNSVVLKEHPEWRGDVVHKLGGAIAMTNGKVT